MTIFESFGLLCAFYLEAAVIGWIMLWVLDPKRIGPAVNLFVISRMLLWLPLLILAVFWQKGWNWLDEHLPN